MKTPRLQIQTSPGWEKPQLSIYFSGKTVIVPLTKEAEKALKASGVSFEG